MNDSFLENSKNLKTYNRLLEKFFSTPEEAKPTALIYGGQPGAGKSLLKSYIKDKHPNIAILDGDELRKHHPEYKKIVKNDPENMPEKTQSFVYALLDKLKTYALNNKKSFALETTFHDGQKTVDSLNEAKKKGFNTELHVLAVNAKASYLSTLKRFEEGNEKGSIGRTVNKEIHFDRARKNTNALRHVVDNKVADDITLYKRVIIDNKPVVAKWKENPKDVLGDFLNERTRDFNSNEKAAYKEIAQDVINSMNKRNAPPDQIKAVTNDLKHFLDENKSKGLGRSK